MVTFYMRIVDMHNAKLFRVRFEDREEAASFGALARHLVLSVLLVSHLPSSIVVSVLVVVLLNPFSPVVSRLRLVPSRRPSSSLSASSFDLLIIRSSSPPSSSSFSSIVFLPILGAIPRPHPPSPLPPPPHHHHHPHNHHYHHPTSPPPSLLSIHRLRPRPCTFSSVPPPPPQPRPSAVSASESSSLCLSSCSPVARLPVPSFSSASWAPCPRPILRKFFRLGRFRANCFPAKVVRIRPIPAQIWSNSAQLCVLQRG